MTEKLGRNQKKPFQVKVSGEQLRRSVETHGGAWLFLSVGVASRRHQRPLGRHPSPRPRIHRPLRPRYALFIRHLFAEFQSFIHFDRLLFLVFVLGGPMKRANGSRTAMNFV